MRCICCNVMLREFEYDWCNRCVKASKDTKTEFKDKQHALITDKNFYQKFKPKRSN